MREVTSALTVGRRRPRLIATDLDGTLLRSDGTGSTDQAALRAVQAAGIRTVLSRADLAGLTTWRTCR